MGIIVRPDFRDVKHPGRNVSYDEMLGRGLCNPLDPDAPMPKVCSRCGAAGSMRNPLMAFPISSDMRDLAKAYLYRAICHDCRIATMPRRRSG